MEGFHKYDKIFAVGHEENEGIFSDPDDDIVIQEKIDGANFRFTVIESEDGIPANRTLVFGSRGNQMTSDKGEDTYVQKSFMKCIAFVREAFAKAPHRFCSGYIYYGENCIKHSYSYDWERMPIFLGFDIYDMKEKKYLVNAINIFEFLGLPFVPVVKYCKAKDVGEFKDSDIPKSVYSSAPAEGIVLKNYSKQLFAKVVTKHFKEVNKEVFGSSKRVAVDDTERLVAMYAPNARIDKCIFKLLDEGEKLDLRLMHKLPGAVSKDIFEEHALEIWGTQYTVNFGKLKKLLAKRCLKVLEMVIEQNER